MTTKNIEWLIGRLRAFSGTSLAPALMHQAADTLQSQAERIKALELDLDVQAGSIRALRAALANAEPTGCTWTKDPDFEMGDTYDSSCGEKWSFIDGGPTENRVRFCQGCGKPVKLIKDTL